MGRATALTVVLLAALLVCARALKLERIEGRQTAGHFLGDNYNVVAVSFVFDEDLYVYETAVCPAAGDDATSDSSRSGVVFSSDGVPDDITILKIGADLSAPISLGLGETLYFAFQMDDSGDGALIYVLPEFGQVMLFTSWTVQYPNAQSADYVHANPGGPVSRLICPAFGDFYPGAFHFMTLRAPSASRFLIQVKTVPTASADLPTSTCAHGPVVEGHVCLDTADFTLPLYESTTFVYYAVKCQAVGLSVTSQEGDWDMYINFLKPAPVLRYTDEGSASNVLREAFGNDEYAIHLCPLEDGSPRPLYFRVEEFSTGPALLALTTNPDAVILRAVADIPPAVFVWSMAGTMWFEDAPPYTHVCDSPLYECDVYWPFLDDLHLFYPTPPVAATRGLFSRVTSPDFPLLGEKPSSNVFHAALLLDINGVQNLGNWKTLRYRFWGRLASKDGRPYQNLDRTSPALEEVLHLLPPACDEDRFRDVSQAMTDQLFRLSKAPDLSSSVNIQLVLSSLATLPTYIGCQHQVSSLLTSQTFEDIIVTDSCIGEALDVSDGNDPCCDKVAAWTHACRPRPVKRQREVYIAGERIARKCHDAECSVAVADRLASLLEINRDCSLGEENDIKLLASTIRLFMDCKAQTIGTAASGVDCNAHTDPGCASLPVVPLGVPCAHDGDCPDGVACDLRYHICEVPYQQMERSLLTCLVMNVSKSTLQYFVNTHGIDPTDLGSAAERLHGAFTVKDCTHPHGFPLMARRRWLYDLYDPLCINRFEDMFCEVSVRLDRYSPANPSTCRDQCGDNGLWYSPKIEGDRCGERTCNWDACTGDEEGEECEATCLADPELCVVCAGGQCVKLHGVTKREQCEQTQACLLADGSVAPDATTLDACLQMGTCTQPCYNDNCVSYISHPGVCASRIFNTATADMATEAERCASAGGRVDVSDAGVAVCVHDGLTAAECTARGHTYHTCEALSSNLCHTCAQDPAACTVPQHILECIVQPFVPCADKAACDASSGFCRGAERALRNSHVYPPSLGVCMTNGYLFPPLYNDPRQTYGTCADWEELEIAEYTPIGCALGSAPTQGLCAQAPSGRWLTMPTSEGACMQFEVCREVVIADQALDPQIRYSPKSPTDCAHAGGVFERPFKWEKGVWLNATWTSGRWIEASFSSQFSIGDTLDFPALAAALQTASTTASVFSTKTSTLCRFGQTSNVLRALACDCVESRGGGGACFDSIDDVTIPLAVGLSCAGDATVIKAPSCHVRLREQSVAEAVGCAALRVFRRPATDMGVSDAPSLSTAFVYRTRRAKYDRVFNEDGVVVGQLVSDGFLIAADSSRVARLLNITVCIAPEDFIDRDTDQFPVPNLAVMTSQEGREAKVYKSAAVHNEGRFICFDVPEFTLGMTVFSAITVDSPGSESDSLSTREQVVLYSSACVYSLIALFSIVLLCLHPLDAVLLRKLGSRMRVFIAHPRTLVYLLMTLFLLIRGVFFFLVGSQTLEDTDRVVDYVLFELPFFFFISSFNITILLWFQLAFSRGRATAGSTTAFLLFTAVMYALFVMFVLLYIFLADDEDEPDCPLSAKSQDSGEDVSQSSAQYGIAIAFRVYVAALCVCVALCTAFFGWRLVALLDIMTSRASSRRREIVYRVAIVATIVSIFFLLQSIFLLVWTILQMRVEDFIYAVWILCVFECAPALALLIAIVPRLRKWAGSSPSTTAPAVGSGTGGSINTAGS